jgi:hypothetical protein
MLLAATGVEHEFLQSVKAYMETTYDLQTSVPSFNTVLVYSHFSACGLVSTAATSRGPSIATLHMFPDFA